MHLTGVGRVEWQEDRLHALNWKSATCPEKVDHLLNRQWKRLTEIQQIQIEMMLDRPGRRIASSRCARIKRKWKKPKAPATRSCPATRRRGGVDAVTPRVLLHSNIERIFRFLPFDGNRETKLPPWER